MPNLKELKNRISSVKSTQKITRAMKVVSAAKLKRAREKAEQAAPYAERMERMLFDLAQNVNLQTAPDLLVGNGKDQTHLFVVITSDRGLCGGFNAAMFKEVKLRIKELESQGKETKIFCIGKKAIEMFSRDYSSKIIKAVEGISKQKRIDFDDALVEAEAILEMFDNNDYDVCTLCYSKFISTISQKVTLQQLVPLDIHSSLKSEVDTSDVSIKPVYDYEPNEEKILQELLPKNLAVQIFHGMLENSASEHGARMTAMDNATRNAGDMIKRLTLVYNRTRQAAITKELIEIISGADAV